MTLSQWFRDYLFLPLEIATRSNPRPMLRVSLNMTVTMLLCGLWHGASWNYVIWGGIHGVALSIHKIWSTWNPLASIKSHRLVQSGWTGFAHVLTLGVVVFSMIFFRTQSLSDAGAYLHHLVFWSHTGTRLISPYILMAIIAVFLVHLLVNKDRNFAEELPRMSVAPADNRVCRSPAGAGRLRRHGFAGIHLFSVLILLAAIVNLHGLEPLCFFQI